MVEITSYELSVQLRDAGFPQPTISRGQYRYMPWKSLCLILSVVDGMLDGIDLDDNSVFHGNAGAYEAVYAPSALDILKELGKGAKLELLSNGRWQCCRKGHPTKALGDTAIEAAARLFVFFAARK